LDPLEAVKTASRSLFTLAHRATVEDAEIAEETINLWEGAVSVKAVRANLPQGTRGYAGENLNLGRTTVPVKTVKTLTLKRVESRKKPRIENFLSTSQ
jgi:hypothetical protein